MKKTKYSKETVWNTLNLKTFFKILPQIAFLLFLGFILLSFMPFDIPFPVFMAGYEGEITFFLKENIRPNFNDRTLDISVKTGSDEFGYPIPYGFSFEENKIKFVLDRPYKNQNSDSADNFVFGPYLGFTHTLQIKEGTYQLEFLSKNATDTYEMSITKETISIKPIQSTFSKPGTSLLRRKPENSMWAICFSERNREIVDEKCSSFFNELSLNSKYLFTRTESGIDRWEGYYALTNHTYYYYQYNGDDKLFLDTLKKSYNENYTMAIFTSTGKVFSCPANCEN